MKDIKYKHEFVMADEILNAKEKNVPVGFLTDDNSIPGYTNKAGQKLMNPIKFGFDEFIITQVLPGSGIGEDRMVSLYLFNPKTGATEAYTCHHAVQFAKFIGSHGKKLIESIMEVQFKNLHINLMHSFMVGSDPEIFVEDKKGKCIPAFDFLKGKQDPEAHTHGPNKKIYWDGFQAEFETEARGCLEQHTGSVYGALVKLESIAKNYDKGARLSNKTVVTIDRDDLQKAKLEHVSLGCMPSYNAYGMQGCVVENPRELLVRPAGGHIHFGIGKSDHKRVLPMVKALDAIIGVMCVSLFAKYDDPVRRQYYGLAGEYRLPPHGLEYRTLSNAWLISPLAMNLVFDIARKALVFGEKGFMKYWKASEEETIKCINTCDVKLAHEIMDRNKDIIVQVIRAAYGSWTDDKKAFEAVFNIFKKGIDCVVKDTSNIERNWNIGSGNGPYYQGDNQPRNFKSNFNTFMKLAG